MLNKSVGKKKTNFWLITTFVKNNPSSNFYHICEYVTF